MSFGVTEADYGEQTPEHFDRFGVRHHVTLETSHGTREFMDANPRGIIKRLGLTLRAWGKRWPGMEVFHLDIWDRPLEIRSYSDGRIKLFLDGEPVYTENTKVVTRNWVKHREVEKWYTERIEQEEAWEKEQQRLAEVEAEKEKRIADVRQRLKRGGNHD